MIPLGIMIATMIVIVLIGYVYAIDCEHTTYSEDWNLTYLRNITALCSNGL